MIDSRVVDAPAAEIAARRERVIAAMAEDNLDALVVAEFGFGGTAVHWLTNWPSTTAAVLVLVPGQPVHLVIEHYNHLPHAEQMVTDADVIWGERKPMQVAADILKKLAPGLSRIGVIGRLSANDYAAVGGQADAIEDFNRAYFTLRLIK